MNLKVSERKVRIKKQNLEILKVFNSETGINFSKNNITFYTATNRNTKNIYILSFFFKKISLKMLSTIAKKMWLSFVKKIDHFCEYSYFIFYDTYLHCCLISK